LNIWIIFAVLLAVLLLPAFVSAQTTHYIRDGATGDGSDWDNALSQLPSTLQRGHTYYIADGTYPGYTFDDAESGTQYITIKKAIESDHGIDTGWLSNYGDGQAVFPGTGTIWNIDTGYWMIDGQTEYGFKLDFTGTGSSAHGLDIDGSYITIQYTDVKGNGHTVMNSDYRHDGVYVVGGTYSHITLAHNYIHDWKRCGIILASGVHDIIIENNLIARTYSTTAAHGQGIQVGASGDSNYDIKIRYNEFYNIMGSGFIFYLGGSSSTHHDIDVYSNIFWTDDPGTWNTATAIGTNTDTTCNNCNAYGNTFYGLTGRGSSGVLELDHGYGTARNNIFYDCNSGFAGTWTASHTASDDDYSSQSDFQLLSSNPFTNSGNGDFTLAAPTDTGMSLPSPYNLDIDGNSRGADSVWDRGAFEYTGTSECNSQNDGTPCSDDWNECTDDYCSSEICTHPDKTGGTPCSDDGIECTGNEQCSLGSCIPTTFDDNLCPDNPDCETKTCTVSGCLYSGCDTPDNLVMWLPFNGDASDASGSGNHGTVYGATLTDDKDGNLDSAYRFDGSDDYIEIPDNAVLDSMSELSVCLWVNIASKSAWDYILSKNNNLFSSSSYGISLDNSVDETIGFSIRTSSGTAAAITNNPQNLNQWYHICGVYDSSEVSIWENGIKQTDTGTNTGLITATSYPVRIGMAENSLNFNGIIDDVRIYTKTLSQEEILTIYGQNCHKADLDCDGVVSTEELSAYIDEWKAGTVTIQDLMEVIVVWKR